MAELMSLDIVRPPSGLRAWLHDIAALVLAIVCALELVFIGWALL
jgi:hypothetical protein